MRSRIVPLNWVQWVTLALLLSFAITTPLLFFRIQGVQKHQNDALRSIICHAISVTEKQPGIPAAQRQRSIRFFESSLADAHLKPCD